MFTLGSRRLVVRGNRQGVVIDDKLLFKLQKENWTWSAHTHPGIRDIVLNSSGGDRAVLTTLKQDRSLIANSGGRRNVFDTENDIHISTNKHNFKVQKK